MLKTKIIDFKNKIDPENLKIIKETFQKGGLIVLPTETVYGLGANIYNNEAIKKIFLVKGRPQDNPLIVHIGTKDLLSELVTEINEDAKKLIENFWPGPLTLIFKKSDKVSNLVTSNLDTVAIRMPNHKITLEILKFCNLPIAAPSANLSGKPSPTIVDHVIEDLNNKVDIIIDGGKCSVGIESTVLDLTTTPYTILRPGIITAKDIEAIIGKSKVSYYVKADDGTLTAAKSPGMKYRHYSPEAEIYLVYNIQKLNEDLKDKKIGILYIHDEFLHYFEQKFSITHKAFLGDTITTIANNLFYCFRNMDKQKVDIIIVEGLEKQEEYYGIINRLEKAASKIFV